ncbi:MAG: hypothetical protein GWO39_03695, partial [Gammaproteobacteria bacterium]|nr:hypothetical protein [Gammaproteobacteria bacterium]NIT62921.1 hypothetical protein [Gammaproteobacteria bacterium]NIV19884.1 hypothetical protein [Gammaproteobacteria bacterium]NIY31501.1 hypothetical protein [Gammaproteobacteria bacterium]
MAASPPLVVGATRGFQPLTAIADARMIDRNLLPPLPPMRAAAVALLLTAVLLAAAPAAHAREGLYIGIGPAGHSVSDDIDGTQRFTAPDGLSEVRAGKPDSGSGFAVGGGYGI